MKAYQLHLTLKSDVLFASGEGWGTVIDTDATFDAQGLPYVPGRRVRGILREAFCEVVEMLSEAGLGARFGLSGDLSASEVTAEVFGRHGQSSPSPMQIGNLDLPDRKSWAGHLDYLFDAHPELFARESVQAHFTAVYQQTAIDENGIAAKGTLRTVRAVRRGLVFTGPLRCEVPNMDRQDLLALAAAHVRHMGTARTRGFGHVRLKLMEPVDGGWQAVLPDLLREEALHAQTAR